jgi:cytidine deaminase
MSAYTLPYEMLTPAELPADEQALLVAALEACNLAHAPWSQFQVGCALQLENGETLTGNNQESPAFPSGLCAERTALFHAGAIGMGEKVRKIAVRAMSAKKEVDVPVTPCGACRQVMLDFENRGGKPIVVLLQGHSGKVLKLQGVAATLLPFAFDFEF